MRSSLLSDLENLSEFSQFEADSSNRHRHYDHHHHRHRGDHSSSGDDSGCGCERPVRPNVFDYIIVGVGSAGAALARELSNDPCVSVLGVEWGQNRDNDPQVLNYPVSLNNQYNPLYSTVASTIAEAGALDQVFATTQGRALGGSSTTKSAIWSRGGPNEWNQLAITTSNPLFNYASMLPTFIALEHYVGLSNNPEQRGVQGPLTVTQFTDGASGTALASAVQAILGQPPLLDYNTSNEYGTSAGQYSIRLGVPLAVNRQTISKALLGPEVVNFDGTPVSPRQLWIDTNSLVDKVLFDSQLPEPGQPENPFDGDGAFSSSGEDLTGSISGGGSSSGSNSSCCRKGRREPACALPKAIGIKYFRCGQIHYAFARRRVILCAGEFSPVILQRSGVGDANHLLPLCIPVVVNNPSVGTGFFTQYNTNIYVDTSIDTTTLLTPTDPTGTLGVVFAPDSTRPTNLRQWYLIAQAGIQPSTNNGVPPVTAGPLIPTSTITFSALNLEPTSRGTIRVASADPAVLPIIDLGLYNDPADLASNIALVRATQGIVNQMNVYLPAGTFSVAYPPASVIASDTDLEYYLRSAPFLSQNYFGGSTVGTSTTLGAVVNGSFEVIGTENLSVCDASVLPFGLSDAAVTAEAYLGLRYASIIRQLEHIPPTFSLPKRKNLPTGTLIIERCHTNKIHVVKDDCGSTTSFGGTTASSTAADTCGYSSTDCSRRHTSGLRCDSSFSGCTDTIEVTERTLSCGTASSTATCSHHHQPKKSHKGKRPNEKKGVIVEEVSFPDSCFIQKAKEKRSHKKASRNQQQKKSGSQ